jgi:hypothetical protein
MRAPTLLPLNIAWFHLMAVLVLIDRACAVFTLYMPAPMPIMPSPRAMLLPGVEAPQPLQPPP